MSEHIAIEDIRDDLRFATNISIVPNKTYFEKPAIGTVIDEEESVRWNREQVERLRTEYDEEAARLKKVKTDTINWTYEEIYAYITQETGIERDKAIRLWSFVNNFHGGYDLLEFLEEQIMLYNDLKPIFKKIK